MSIGLYQFTDSVQVKILTILWRDVDAFPLYRDCVKPAYFEKAVRIDICRMILDYWEEYEKPPTYEVLEEEIEKLTNKSKSKAEIKKEYLKTLDQMADTDLDDIEYIKDKIVEFGKRQALIEAVIQSSKVIESGGEYQTIKKLVDDALLVGEANTDLGLFHFENIEDRIWSYTHQEDVIERIPTGKDLLDGIMKGGLGKSEMGVVLAPPGRGKTTMLIDIAAHAITRGYNVIHYSFENSPLQVQRNYDNRLLKRNMEYIKENPAKSIAALGNIKKYMAKENQLVIKKYPPKTVNVNTIKAHLQQLRLVKGFIPDVIVVDYGSLLKPTRKYGEKRDDIEAVYEELRALADTENVALWTAAQANRPSLGKMIVTMQDLAECFAIANTADFMMALCQNDKKERPKGIMRYFIAKNRDNVDKMTLIGEEFRDMKIFSMDSILKPEDYRSGNKEDEEDEDGDKKSTHDEFESRRKKREGGCKV